MQLSGTGRHRNALDYYRQEAPHKASAFVDALEKSAIHIQRSPGTSSPRYAQDSGLAGLRFWGLNTVPSSLFHIEQADYLWVIRLVHMGRDIPATLQHRKLLFIVSSVCILSEDPAIT